ncbi:hypothetical protein C8F04DRAFT_1331374 [Mycena alexandri]|uniref:Uncharacterized protein n=1 Tax=Mycena alexandri TaxID=1745969 RepID=A0AAD6S063_9AGAR|nr:hypothetical protein C8F04DRAFT_1331374 [Mycena alexandri]
MQKRMTRSSHPVGPVTRRSAAKKSVPSAKKAPARKKNKAAPKKTAAAPAVVEARASDDEEELDPEDAEKKGKTAARARSNKTNHTPAASDDEQDELNELDSKILETIDPDLLNDLNQIDPSLLKDLEDNTDDDTEAPVPPDDEGSVPPDDPPMPPVDDAPVPPDDDALVPPDDDAPVPPDDDAPVPPINDAPVPPIDDAPVPPVNHAPVPPDDGVPVPPIDDTPLPPVDDTPLPPVNDAVPPVNDTPVPPAETPNPPFTETPVPPAPPVTETPAPPVTETPPEDGPASGPASTSPTNSSNGPSNSPSSGPPSTHQTPPVPPETNKEGGAPKAVVTVANPHAPAQGPNLTLDGASWSARNPDAPQQPPPKLQKKPELGDAEKASLKLKREEKLKEKQEYESAVAAFEGELKERAEELAKRFDKTVTEVKKALRGNLSLAKERKVSLHNAKVWRFSKEINANRGPGDKIKPPELQRLMKADPAYSSLTQEEEELLLQEHAEHKGVKKSGTRLTNAAAARDVTAFGTRIERDCASLYRRTGAVAFITIGRSDVNDTLKPTCLGVADAIPFFPRILHTTADQFAIRFDNYTVNKDAIGLDLGYQTLRRDCTSLVSENLEQKINKKVSMRYEDYDRFVLDHGYELLGWPEDVPFMAPSNLGTVERLRPLYDALVSGSCRWEPISEERKKELAAAVAKKEKKSKKERSDKGMSWAESKAAREKRKRKERDDDDEDDDDDDEREGGHKKRRRTNLSGYTSEERREHKRKMDREKKQRQRAKAKERAAKADESKTKTARKRKRAAEEEGGEEPVAKKTKGKSSGKKVVSRETISDSGEEEWVPEGSKKKAPKLKPAKEVEEDESDKEPEDDVGSESDSSPRRSSLNLPFAAKPSKAYQRVMALADENRQRSDRAMIKKKKELRRANRSLLLSPPNSPRKPSSLHKARPLLSSTGQLPKSLLLIDKSNVDSSSEDDEEEDEDKAEGSVEDKGEGGSGSGSGSGSGAGAAA